ncbi:DUF397 domain-containing protein [Couchioplanes caeruleus]|uniref:DUF397 domain-containing protein n=2 Tax=Couchioplanes caeruleus TaxID=56438 RepID=A0A1K0GNY8_9ACTN|nr:DUF397 domain-containing protein [Couchioplanes caeruleus]OJF12812.1 DUF397 domain-containing protein [Couchioplanes caeruleus subsp. caeruleus]ROP30659.1 uncharacterized protein DUF397 [Couchioplanes caeruleus]
MRDRTEQTVVWRRASRCGTTSCVEVAKIGHDFVVRDSKNPQQRHLRFSAEEWSAFASAVKRGEFDL